MDLKQKFLEGNVVFEVQESFADSLSLLDEDVYLDILVQMKDLCEFAPFKQKIVQTFGGVSHYDGYAYFFELSLINELQHMPFFLDITEISSDDYLDYILENKTIKQVVSGEIDSP